MRDLHGSASRGPVSRLGLPSFPAPTSSLAWSQDQALAVWPRPSCESTPSNPPTSSPWPGLSSTTAATDPQPNNLAPWQLLLRLLGWPLAKPAAAAAAEARQHHLQLAPHMSVTSCRGCRASCSTLASPLSGPTPQSRQIALCHQSLGSLAQASRLCQVGLALYSQVRIGAAASAQAPF